MPPPSSPQQVVTLSEPAHIEAGSQGLSSTSKPLFEAAGSCQRAHPGVGARRFAPVRTSASVALAALGEGSSLRVLAYVADGDEALLHTVDVGQGRELGVTALRGAPEQVLVLGDGRVAVTLRQTGELQILEPAASPEAALEPRCVVSVPTEPVALAESPDGKTLALTSAWAQALTVFDAGTISARGQVALPREPRSVVISDDGKRAFVAHVVNAKMSVVDLEDPAKNARQLDLSMKPAISGLSAKPRSGCQGFALVSAVDMPADPSQVGPGVVGEQPPVSVTPKPPTPVAPRPGPLPRTKPAGRLFAPFVTVDPGEATRATSGYGNAGAPVPTEFSAISVVDAAAERLFSRTLTGVVPHGQVATRGSVPATDCLLPRAVSYANNALFVACQGNDTLVEYDARGIDPARSETRRWAVPSGPNGVAIDTINGVAVVYGAFQHKLALVSLRAEHPAREIVLRRPQQRALTAEQERGRILFHTAHDPRISSDGRACASCHPDGREDALTWSTPEGPRQTAMLLGRLGDSAPFGWTGASKTVEEHLQHTFQRLGGTGLPDDATRAVVAYLASTRPPHQGRLTVWEEAQKSRIEQGRTLFASSEAACASCHPDGRTDGQNHSVSATKSRADRTSFDTPSLRYIKTSAPYFHDGRYLTLQAMLEAPDHAMGYSLHLDREQRLALAAYLESL